MTVVPTDPKNRRGPPVWVYPAAGSAALLGYLVLSQGEDVSRWSRGAIVAVLISVAVTLGIYLWRSTQESMSPKKFLIWRASMLGVQLPQFPSPVLPIVFLLLGSLSGLLVASFIIWDQRLPWPLRVLAGVGIPMAAGIFAGELSPRRRFERAQERRLDEVFRRMKKALEDAEQQERLKVWLPRLNDALYWWKTFGARLNSDDPAEAIRSLEDHMRVNGPGLVGKRDDILKAFNDKSDPCATHAAASELARWAIAEQSELLSEYFPAESDRTIERLTFVLRAHHRRNYFVLSEADPALFAHAARQAPPLKKDESPEQLYRRLAAECDSILAFKENELRNIDKLAAELPATERDEWKRRRIELLLLVVAHELRRRMEFAQ